MLVRRGHSPRWCANPSNAAWRALWPWRRCGGHAGPGDAAEGAPHQPGGRAQDVRLEGGGAGLEQRLSPAGEEQRQPAVRRRAERTSGGPSRKRCLRCPFPCSWLARVLCVDKVRGELCWSSVVHRGRNVIACQCYVVKERKRCQN
jgi:hypothetical protein